MVDRLAEALKQWDDYIEREVGHGEVTAMILGAARRWLNLYCPNCHGEKAVYQNGDPQTVSPCPVCGGHGYNPDLVEAVFLDDDVLDWAEKWLGQYEMEIVRPLMEQLIMAVLAVVAGQEDE
jgi:ribosomal protein S27E